jgi:hypothetical protein
MSPNSRPALPFVLDISDVSRTLQRFLEGAPGSIDATVDNVVRVRVDPSMRVLSINFLETKADPGVLRELERATVAAVNLALQKAALAAGEALAELNEKVTLRPPPGPSKE